MVRRKRLGWGLALVASVIGLGAFALGAARSAVAEPSATPSPAPTASALPPGAAPAGSAGASASADLVVARVGTKTVTLGELERRMRQMPAFMLRRYGSTADEIRHRFLDEVLVRDLVLTQGAIDQGLDKRPDVDDKVKAILRSALYDQLKKGASPEQITDDEVKKFYESNSDKFISPRRISIWRILVGSEPEAREIIAEVKQGEDVKKWNQIARDKSLDKASSMRSGNLGFVNPDGTTAQPELKLDVSIFDAADKVKDGEIVPEPVKEGDKWAVVWRRQGMRAVTRTLESEAATIRAALADEKMRKSADDLLTSLRAAGVGEMHPELCDMLSITDTGDVEKARRPGVLAKARSNAQPTPQEEPAGQR